MNPQDAVDLGRNAVMLTLLLSAPALAVGLVVGLVVGLLQALTQVQEQTVAFVPKLIAMFLTVALLMPWLLAHFSDYWIDLITNIPNTL
ncbi:MAG: flagellar biosynthesis protein FliQ [Planctomycetaceae bacterium]|nr:flagellar biosynthesis protein FliQ [Planctomycetaceae bacterium]